MHGEELERKIYEIEMELLRADPSLDKRFGLLDPVRRSHEIVVLTLTVLSALLLAVGLIVLSSPAFLAGAACFVAAFVVDSRDERRYRQSVMTRIQHHGSGELRAGTPPPGTTEYDADKNGRSS